MTPKQAYILGRQVGMLKLAANGPTPAERNVMGFPSSRRGARLRRQYGNQQSTTPVSTNASVAGGVGPTAAERNRMGLPSSRTGARLRQKYSGGGATVAGSPNVATPNLAAATSKPTAPQRYRPRSRHRTRRSAYLARQ